MATERERLLELLDRQEARVRAAFVDFIRLVRSEFVLGELLERIEANDLPGAFRIVDSYVARFGNVIPDVFRDVGADASAGLQAALPGLALAIDFDSTFPRAAELAAASRARLIREFSEQQHQATQQAISRAISEGRGAVDMSRAFRDSLGLTATQEAYVASYRRGLETLDARVLDRALRDRRFDDRIATALQRQRPLTARQIDAMVNRYRARAIMMRAETIARTEALTAYSQAREEALQQMLERTGIPWTRVNRLWHATHDERVRDWHLSMEGERRPPGEPFVDGLGNRLMYPGDPASPAETRINCRCTLGFEVLPAA